MGSGGKYFRLILLTFIGEVIIRSIILMKSNQLWSPSRKHGSIQVKLLKTD